MAFWSERVAKRRAKGPILVVEGLDVYYGRAHALQGVSLSIDHGVFGIVGRNGMGKTTLCNAITGLVPATGSVKLHGEELLGLAPNEITKRGIAYVPQGRRVWPSLTVDETLRLVAPNKRDVERVYTMFPRLAERKSNGGAQLSGGEQQMLAIGRALLLQPKLLVMDEPTEGLAPVIVEQVAQALRDLAAEGEIAVLLIEQNLGVAIEVADNIGVMVNGRIAEQLPAAQLAADRDLQERLLGVRSGGHDEDAEAEAAVPEPVADSPPPTQVLTVRRATATARPAWTTWRRARCAASRAGTRPTPARRWSTSPASRRRAREATPTRESGARVVEFPVAASAGRAAYVAGTFDTKGRELFFLRQCLERLGLRVVTVDLSTSGKPSPASVHPREVARHHPQGEAAVFSGDRGSAVSAMALAFESLHPHAPRPGRHHLGRRLGRHHAGHDGDARAADRRARRSWCRTMASGDTRPYVGPSDICMMYSVTDVQGINRISEKVLSNAAHALAGMIAHPPPAESSCQAGARADDVRRHHDLRAGRHQAAGRRLRLPGLPCHRRGRPEHGKARRLGPAGRRDRRLHHRDRRRDRRRHAVGRADAAGRVRAPCACPTSARCGALDMANFGAWDTVPERFKGRRLYRHNPNVTLMRTTVDENRAIGEFIAGKLNAMQGPVRFLIPEGGVSAIDKPGQPFHDPEADRVLFDTIAQRFRAGPDRKLQRLPLHLNDEAFAEALVAAWHEISRSAVGARRA